MNDEEKTLLTIYEQHPTSKLPFNLIISLAHAFFQNKHFSIFIARIGNQKLRSKLKESVAETLKCLENY